MTDTLQFAAGLALADFTYPLPEDRIARFPLARRDASRLLVWSGNRITDSFYHQLPRFLPDGALLAFNKSKVVEARLLFRKPSGGRIELFCLEPGPGEGDMSQAMAKTGGVRWQCLIGGASKWPAGMELETSESGVKLFACLAEKNPDHFTILFRWEPAGLTFAAVLQAVGQVPLPPYLKRTADASDGERYQTVYAAEAGSVAAPTAGLHFTPELLKELEAAGMASLYLTLHVGAGTFLPVKSEVVADHRMHSEWMDVPADAIAALLSDLDRPVIAVGTTSLRTLESLYWLGVQASAGALPAGGAGGWPELSQTEPYRNTAPPPVREALEALLAWTRAQPGQRLIAATRLFIVPGYRFRIVQGLISNFHQPQSTLLMLVAALTNNKWREIYQHALENEYRFLSYGDGCLLLPQ